MPQWLKVGSIVVAAEVLIHGVAAGLLNGWEDMAGNLVFLVIFGLVVGGLVFGLLVRLGSRLSREPHRNRAASTGLVCGLLAVASYGVFFVGAPPIAGAGALVLGRAGLGQVRAGRGGAGPAWIAIGLGTIAIAFWLFLYIAALMLGDFPFGLF